MQSFDDYLEENITFGRYHYISFFVLSLASFLDGFQVIYLVVVLPIQKREFQLTTNELTLFSTFQFFGMFLSYAIYSKFTDIIGRKNLLMIGLLQVSIGLMLHSIADSVALIVICRLMLGMTVGWLWGLPTILMIEIVPASIRGRVATAGELFFILGIVYLTLCCQIEFATYDTGDWKTIARVNSYLAFISLVLVWLFANESPRYYLMRMRYEDAWKIINLINETNRDPIEFIPLNEEQKIQLITWQENILCQQTHKPGFKALLAKEQRRLTILIWVFSVFLNILDKGITIILPFAFLDTEQNLSQLFESHLAELPAAIMTALLIDSKRFGRKRGLQISFSILSFALISLYLLMESVTFQAFLLMRFSLRSIWSFYNPLVIEAYSTYLRSTGSGAAQMVGKLAGAITPFVVIQVYFMTHTGVFLFLFVVAICALVILSRFPDDLTRQHLDKAKPTSSFLELGQLDTQKSFQD